MLSAGGSERAHALAYSPDGGLLAVGTSSGVRLYDAQTLSEIQSIQTGTWARSLAFSADGAILAAGLFDHTIHTYAIPGGQPRLTLEGHGDWVRSLALAPDGGRLYSVSDDGSLRAWDLATGNNILTSTALDGPRAIAISPNGQTLAVGLRLGAVQLLRAADLSPLAALEGHTDWVRCLAFSPDGGTLASAGFDTTIRTWDVSSGAPLHTLAGHTASVLGIAFSPDGKTLASGSVDTTVRLWRVSDGSPQRVMQGHTGFVYAVAFSPDGKTLASGGEDNRVRLWDAAVPTTPADLAAPPAGSSDCRACHHPTGLFSPARVVEMRCDECHQGGIGINWCPFFDRSQSAAPAEGYFYPEQPSGVPVTDGDLAILLASPANGETMYTRSGYISPAILGGMVRTSGDATQVLVTLEARPQNGGETLTYATHPSADGSFRFELDINPGGNLPVPVKPSGKECANCHEDYEGLGGLPEGLIALTVTAEDPHGRTARDERWFTVDISSFLPAAAQVIDAESGLPLPGAPVLASSVLYHWRDRYASGAADDGGGVALALEQLSAAPTTYHFAVPEVVLNGILYQGIEPAEVTLQPDTQALETIVLYARSLKGSISGVVHDADGAPAAGATVWALAYPSGPAHQALAGADGSFAFTDLPITAYRLAGALENATTSPFELDLGAGSGDGAEAQQDLALYPPTMHAIHAAGQDGRSLPFAWFIDDETRASFAASLLSGEITFPGESPFGGPDSARTGVVAAPGYYAQALRFDGSQSVTASLALRPDTRRLPWGSGEALLPAETLVEESGETLSVQRGWLWGTGGDTPLELAYPGGRIRLESGSFALQVLPGQARWLYLFSGRAQVWLPGAQQPLELEGEQMAALQEGAVALPLEPALLAAVQPEESDAPAPVYEPGLAARLANSLRRLGIGAAQGVTLITYSLLLVVLVLLPVSGVVFFVKRRPSTSLRS